eukprot:gene7408-7472_t
MAWRDSRRNRSRLLLFISAIVFGIAALVAIYSFRFNLEKDIDAQAATLIGADLSVSASKPADAAVKPLLDSLGDKRSEERSFVSMIYFPKGNGTRLVQVKALQGGFPYYGSLETTPLEAGRKFKSGKMALVDKTLMLQFNARVNDSVKLGNVTFLIAGILNKAPGQTGVASAIHIYIREKISSIAIMRCLGVKASEAFLIYLIQIVGIGIVGSMADISWLAIGQGVLNISPLNTLRMSYEDVNLVRDPMRWLLNSWVASIFFTIGIMIAFMILTLTAWLLMRVMRVLIKNSWSYLTRQGFANLYRPNNQTIILIVSIGLSTAFICTLFFIQGILINQVKLSSSGNQANMILFDIQSSQEKAIAALTKQQGLPVLQQVPIVTIRLQSINGKTAADLKKDSTLKISRHAFSNEYRVTYRDTLTPSEKIIKGEWIGKADNSKDIPGLTMSTVVASIRQVNWNKIQTNFQIVFPNGVLDDAPQFHVLLTHVSSTTISAKYQQAVVKQFPNISVIDLGQVLVTVDDLLEKISYIIRFMSAFSIITGIVVLIASVRISKYQRIRESVLLRTLGASRKQILTITALEYLFLGALSALTGIVIALAGSFFLTAGYGLDDPAQAFPGVVQNKIDSAKMHYKVINAGVSGETTAGGKARINWILKQHVDVFVLELGANDGLRGIPAKYPEAKLVMLGMQVPPNMGTAYSLSFKATFPALAAKNKMVLVPFLLKDVGGVPSLNQKDGIHPTAEGAKIVGNTVWQGHFEHDAKAFDLPPLTGSGTALVLIHGHPFDHTMWYPQVVAFSDNFQDYATDVILLLDYLNVKNFHLAGLSMGGQVIMEIFRQAPQRIKSLIFADTFAGLDTPEVKQGRYDTADRLEKEGMTAYADEVIYKMIRPDHVSSMPEVSEHILTMMKATSSRGAAIALRARSERIDYLHDVLPEINVPTLVIVGRDDEFTPVAKAEETPGTCPTWSIPMNSTKLYWIF